MLNCSSEVTSGSEVPLLEVISHAVKPSAAILLVSLCGQDDYRGW